MIELAAFDTLTNNGPRDVEFVKREFRLPYQVLDIAACSRDQVVESHYFAAIGQQAVA